MAHPGKRNLITDVEGLQVGSAHDATVKTGVTVIVPDSRAICAVSVMGGGPGTRETDALSLGTLVDEVDAIVLSGGSVYGLAAADGTISAMGAEGKGFGLVDVLGVPKSPIVPSAILYDLANGGAKSWGTSPPYKELGAAAYNNIGPNFTLGAAGAGFGAMAGQFRGGLGSTSLVTTDGFQVGALVAVNCFGSVKVPNSDAYWAAPYEIDREFGGVPFPSSSDFNPEDWGAAKANPNPRENTTIACVGTNADLTPSEAKRVAQMASAGLARAIRPVFAPFDGDVVFTLATAQKPMGPDARPFLVARLGELAANCLARAVARGVFVAGGAAIS